MGSIYMYIVVITKWDLDDFKLNGISRGCLN